MMPLSSMAQAVNTYVAQNRGADNWERVRKGIRYAYTVSYTHLDVYKRQVLQLMQHVM